MLGCQVTQTHLSLTAHIWPWFDQSRSCTPCVPPAQSSSRLVWAWLIYSKWLNLNVISMLTLSIQPKHIFTQWNLRANWSNRQWKSPIVLSRVDVGKDQRVNQVRFTNYANELSGKWLELLRKPSHQKLGCEKSKFCKIQGVPHVDTVDTCMQQDKEPYW